MNFLGNNFIQPCKQDFVFRFCLPGQLQNPQSLTENAAHSYHYLMPKRRLSCSRLFCSQGGTSGSWPDSWLPHLDRSQEANLTHSGGVFQRSRCFKIHSLSNGTPIPVPARSNPLWATKDRAQPQFFSEDLMAMHPSPVLAPLHVSVSGNTLLSHRLGTL